MGGTFHIQIGGNDGFDGKSRIASNLENDLKMIFPHCNLSTVKSSSFDFKHYKRIKRGSGV